MRPGSALEGLNLGLQTRQALWQQELFRTVLRCPAGAYPAGPLELQVLQDQHKVGPEAGPTLLPLVAALRVRLQLRLA